MNHCDPKEMPQPTNNFPDLTEHACLVQTPAKITLKCKKYIFLYFSFFQ